MTKAHEPQKEIATIDKILHLENRIQTLTADFEGLFQNYVSNLILLRELRAKLAEEMVDDAFPPSSDDKTPTVSENCNVQ